MTPVPPFRDDGERTDGPDEGASAAGAGRNGSKRSSASRSASGQAAGARGEAARRTTADKSRTRSQAAADAKSSRSGTTTAIAERRRQAKVAAATVVGGSRTEPDPMGGEAPVEELAVEEIEDQTMTDAAERTLPPEEAVLLVDEDDDADLEPEADAAPEAEDELEDEDPEGSIETAETGVDAPGVDELESEFAVDFAIAPEAEPEPAPVRRTKSQRRMRRFQRGTRIRPARPGPGPDAPVVLSLSGLGKRYGSTVAVQDVSLDVRAGSFYGIVGPNGAGKTTTLSIISGLLRPDAGTVKVHGIDVWKDPRRAKQALGVLPDRLRVFDRLTGSQLLYYAGVLRGMNPKTVRQRSADLAAAFGIEEALDRLVADYSAGMTKKVALAASMIHSPRVLVLDEPFESVDPVSTANISDILQRFADRGGTVIISSHGMDLIERACDSVAVIVGGKVLAEGTMDEVRDGRTLEDRFVDLAGGRKAAEGLEWLHSSSD
ncbi:ABC transporter ATP-binding protein [Agromyces rhizosphaerae]|uniref:ABC transporter ATP-binding protein n=1 Tax=Agromyces rhizosphaerae TaxID=88374 RepID=UPI002491832A|nr:ABC transporter ATP-binding protein [Agromyces rhizosphaerae]